MKFADSPFCPANSSKAVSGADCWRLLSINNTSSIVTSPIKGDRFHYPVGGLLSVTWRVSDTRWMMCVVCSVHGTCFGVECTENFVFSLQIQLYGFNKELYHNMSEAQHKSQGIVGISLMVQVNFFIIKNWKLKGLFFKILVIFMKHLFLSKII